MLARALFVAAELDIAEHLSQKSMNATQLAQVTNTDESSLDRLLHFLTLHEIFTQDSENIYHTTDFSRTMCADHPQTIKPFLLHDDETRWHAFGHLGYSIKTGKASFDNLYGKSYFDYLEDKPTLSKRFDDAMTIISQQEDAAIAQKITFNGTVADVGGGKGQLISNILKTNPTVQGIVFDLPQVIENLEADFPAEKRGGTFFEPIEIQADNFILKRILHDWNNEKALEILRNVAAAMDQNSKLFIVDGILDHAQNKKLLAAVDLAMLALFQGKERNLHEFETLTAQAGLKIVQITPINDLVSVLECKKAN